MGPLLTIFAYLVLAAVLLLLVDRLNLGMSVSGFGTAMVVAIVLAAFGLLFLLMTLPFKLAGEAVDGVLVNWLIAAFLLWLAGKFVPGFVVRRFTSALLAALVLALMLVGLQAIVAVLVPA